MKRNLIVYLAIFVAFIIACEEQDDLSLTATDLISKSATAEDSLTSSDSTDVESDSVSVSDSTFVCTKDSLHHHGHHGHHHGDSTAHSVSTFIHEHHGDSTYHHGDSTHIGHHHAGDSTGYHESDSSSHNHHGGHSGRGKGH